MSVKSSAIEGLYSKIDQYWIIRSKEEWAYNFERNWLCVGGAGDSIEFGYRKNQAGIFAYNPIVDEYTLIADTTEELKGWLEGSITG